MKKQFEFYRKAKMIRCPGCGFEYFPLVSNPVKCPRCQYFFIRGINKQARRKKRVKGTVKKAA